MFLVLCLWLPLHHKVNGKLVGIPVAGILKPVGEGPFVVLLTSADQFLYFFLIHHYLFLFTI